MMKNPKSIVKQRIIVNGKHERTYTERRVIYKRVNLPDYINTMGTKKLISYDDVGQAFYDQHYWTIPRK